MTGSFKVPAITNEEVRAYTINSPERAALADAIAAMKLRLPVKIPLVIGGREITTELEASHVNPANHAEVLSKTSQASKEHVKQAIAAAAAAKDAWETTPLAARSAVFLRAAELIAGKYRYELLAATMLGQGKNIYQAEIDAAAELIDFLKFNCQYADELAAEQPVCNAAGVWNRAEYNALDGFVYAVTPFNFTAIAGNLVAAPALMGNTVIWKPSPYAVLSNYLLFQIFVEAGVPAGVINFVPGDAETVTAAVLGSRDFAALHFTGSTQVFQNLYGQIAANLPAYRSYPRVVGETGGKNFHLIHSSADVVSAARGTVRAAFEYQGQKCSAASRAYVPASVVEEFKSWLLTETEQLSEGDPTESLHAFLGPVIHEGSFHKLEAVFADLRKDPAVDIIEGGTADNARGFFVKPTVVVSADPDHYVFKREFFGPLLAIYVYDDAEFDDVVARIDADSEYALTGAVFARDRHVIESVSSRLRHAAGNFYVNDKCTGAVVGQQWFGGSRKSGTNDKAGSANILTRFVNIRNIKENFNPTTTVLYPSNIQS
ncbi:Aldehyde/histidinol dehydrogenase [Dipodascopsis tothii]|uniref:Aldehyde/histidinol dehydrogenase n=1 Tax=Dipodascopsis tothii TaxID=44089 RepID=UPI0034CD821A